MANTFTADATCAGMTLSMPRAEDGTVVTTPDGAVVHRHGHDVRLAGRLHPRLTGSDPAARGRSRSTPRGRPTRPGRDRPRRARPGPRRRCPARARHPRDASATRRSLPATTVGPTFPAVEFHRGHHPSRRSPPESFRAAGHRRRKRAGRCRRRRRAPIRTGGGRKAAALIARRRGRLVSAVMRKSTFARWNDLEAGGNLLAGRQPSLAIPPSSSDGRRGSFSPKWDVARYWPTGGD